TTVKTRPNHYEVLGLTPDATGDEIARAFAREVSMFRPQPLGGVAGAGIAYAVLRDPAKRRAYDDSLGLNQPPPAPPAVPEPEKAVTPFAAHHMHALARPKANAEPRTAAFIASALRDPVEAAVQPETQPDPPQAPRETASA